MKSIAANILPIGFFTSISIGPLMLHYVFGFAVRPAVLIPYGAMMFVYALVVVDTLRSKARTWRQ